METFKRRDWDELMSHGEEPCLSFYVRTHRAGADMQQARIGLKNLAAEAEESLVARGWRVPEARDLLAPVRERSEDDRFWREQSDGLAIFLAPGFLRVWKMPLPFETRLWIGARFHTKPLVPLLVEAEQEGFYLLAANQNGATLYRGSTDGLTEVDVPNLPHDLESLVSKEVETPVVQARSGQPAIRGKEGAVYHGQGDQSQQHKENLRLYLRAIDRALAPVLHGKTDPLVFAGVDYLFPIYQRESTYPHLVEQAVTGSVERLPLGELHKQAIEVLAPLAGERRQREAARCAALADSELGTSIVTEAVESAEQGRVDTAFVATDRTAMGRYETATARATLDEDGVPESEDLLDRLVVATLAHGGRVYAVPASEVPGGGLAAAAYRYPAPSTAPAAHDAG